MAANHVSGTLQLVGPSDVSNVQRDLACSFPSSTELCQPLGLFPRANLKAMMSIGVTMIGAWVFALGLRAIDSSQDCRLSRDLCSFELRFKSKKSRHFSIIFLCDRTFIDDRLL